MTDDQAFVLVAIPGVFAASWVANRFLDAPSDEARGELLVGSGLVLLALGLAQKTFCPALGGPFCRLAAQVTTP